MNLAFDHGVHDQVLSSNNQCDALAVLVQEKPFITYPNRIMKKLDSGKIMDWFLSHLKIWPDRNFIRADTSLFTDQGNAATGAWAI
jgi:hypothetical protein